MNTAVLHAGEREVQRRLGVHERMADAMGRGVREFMPEQHRELFRKLPTFFVGSLDEQRRPWASVLAGPPGFITAPDDRHLRVAALPQMGDPWTPQIDTPVGLLGLEPHTRRRNRMNGSIVGVDEHSFTVHVDQSYGNCPKYIQARTPTTVQTRAFEPAAVESQLLSAAAQHLIRSADTLFIATASAQARAHAGAEGVDVSHRGGLPGFVRLTESNGASVLLLPDYQGNFFFNTLGNITAYPFAGLLFIDYTQGHLLHLSGTARVLWDSEEIATFEGAQRLIEITVEAAVWRANALPLRWSPPAYASQFG